MPPSPILARNRPEGYVRKLWGVLLLMVLLSAGFSAEVLQRIVVRPGDTLWSIANRTLKDPKRWPEILKYNSLPTSDPTVALPGMELQVPVMLIKENLRAATLTYVFNEVRYRRRETPDWRVAQESLRLYEEDGLRTMRLAQARVRFSSGELLKLSENSLIILRPERAQEEAELLKGEIRAGRSRVVTTSAKITPRTKDTDYRARVREDLSTLVQVYRGLAAVEAQGETVEVRGGFASDVPFQRPPSPPTPLPPQPVLEELEVAAAGTPTKTQGSIQAPRVVLHGTRVSLEVPRQEEGGFQQEEGSRRAAVVAGQAMIQGYRLQVAKEKNFSSPGIDRYLDASQKVDLQRLNLEDGQYWWRVALVDLLGLEGEFSPPRFYSVDTVAPLLQILQPGPGTRIEGEFLRIEGRTDPGAYVLVNDRSVEVASDGSFQATVFLRLGENRIEVRAQDRVGNATREMLQVRRSGEAAEMVVKKETEIRENPVLSGAATVGLGILTLAIILGIVAAIL
ncbi:MAG: LysM peptidoglycan-binding domain-containing protein [Elusimicrobia bacterium]|nr:LysM peptidoglycan-binding domain-containing protein [Elusimicrobiota bacterium]